MTVQLGWKESPEKLEGDDGSEAPDNMRSTMVDRERVAWPGGHPELCVAMVGGGAQAADGDAEHRRHFCFRQSQLQGGIVTDESYHWCGGVVPPLVGRQCRHLAPYIYCCGGDAKLLHGLPAGSVHQIPVTWVHLSSRKADLATVAGQGQGAPGEQKTRAAIKVNKRNYKQVDRNCVFSIWIY